MSGLGVISLLITSQNPSFNTRIQSLSDYNEKIMIDRIKDRIWDWLVHSETGGGRTEGEHRPGQERFRNKRKGRRQGGGRWMTKARKVGGKENERSWTCSCVFDPTPEQWVQELDWRKGAPFPKSARKSEIISLCPKETCSPYMCANVWAQDWGLNGSRSAVAI